MKPRVFFLLPLFLNGGVERWALNWARILEDEHQIFFVIHGELSDALEIPNHFRVIHCTNDWKSVCQKMRDLSLGVDDLVVAGLTPSNLLGLRLKRLFGCFLITSIHVSLERVGRESLFKAIARRLVYEWIGIRSDRMVAVSEGIRREILLRRPVVVYNPVVTVAQIELSREGRRGILAVGRLEEQKGFDLLLRAYALCSPETRIAHPLTIVGEGSLRDELDALAASLGLKGLVTFEPFTREVFRAYRSAHTFVLSSRYEGFGNVLAEALASGCRCVSFDVRHGPREILGEGTFGELVPSGDIPGLSRAIERSLLSASDGEDEALRTHCQKFTLEQIRHRIHDLIMETKT